MDPSRTRQAVRELYQEAGELLQTVLARSPLFPASLYEQKSRCGKPLCKCAQGAYRHRLWCVSFVEAGRSRTRVVPKVLRSTVEGLTGDYRRFRQARRRLARLAEELLAKVDALAQARAEAGRERFARLVAKAKETGAGSRSKEGGSRR
jgi:hypothetical protein